jgi:HK97 family phage major capsid protein
VRFAFNDATLQVIEEMVDAQNRPLWLPSIIGGAPATVLQTPYVIDPAIPNVAAGVSSLISVILTASSFAACRI